MTVRILPALTSEELGFLVELAIETSAPKIPAIHLTRLIMLGYVLMRPEGPLVTGDGLILITENA
jgi:hypothetical protein